MIYIPAAALMHLTGLASLASLVPRTVDCGVRERRERRERRPRGGEHQGERGGEEGREGRRAETEWERTTELGFPPRSVLVVRVVK